MAAADIGELTARERDVVLAAADGADTRAIAGRLFLSPRTVEHHLSAAYRKLGVSNRAALVALLRNSAAEQAPVTRYAVSGDSHIAYQILGDGPRDLILIPGFVSIPPLLLAALLAADRTLDASLLAVIERFRGRPAPRRDGVIYTFDGAVRAVDCALALIEQQPSLRLTVHAGELRFTTASVSGPAADIAARAVNQSPAGQVTVTSVVKDLALGSRLDLTAGPTVSLPGGEQLQLFLARPPSAQVTAAGPGQDA